MFEEIISSLRRNKMRTALTGFSVAWGIFILIVLLGAGNGLIHSFEGQSRRRALNSMKVTPGWTTMQYKGLESGRRVKLNEADMREMVFANKANIIEALPVVTQSGITISHGQEYVSSSLTGVYPEHPTVEIARQKSGRFINNIDIDECRKVCVIGDKTEEILFPQGGAIGSFVNASGVMYKVIGVYSDDNNGTQSMFIPYTTLMTIYNKEGFVSRILLTTKGLDSEEENDRFENDVRTILSQRRNFSSEDTGAVWIWNRMKNYLQTKGAMDILTTAVWVIGILTLLSGVVGVSNIMLITVKERTHEFGIRKALGAKPRQILALIIIESIVITSIFGYIGMVVGVGATELINTVVENMESEAFTDPTVDMSIAIEATLTLIIAGTLAGFFPARKAVSIKPIEALRG
ncbi:MAG: ABC transporter permease [Bacteroidales bacterium]|nr:ABC transporter permease [Bacteroidales bacterium]